MSIRIIGIGSIAGGQNTKYAIVLGKMQTGKMQTGKMAFGRRT